MSKHNPAYDTYSEQDTADKLILPYLEKGFGFPSPSSLDYQAQHLMQLGESHVGRYDGLYLAGGSPMRCWKRSVTSTISTTLILSKRGPMRQATHLIGRYRFLLFRMDVNITSTNALRQSTLLMVNCSTNLFLLHHGIRSKKRSLVKSDAFWKKRSCLPFC